jgi:hypothetical protein
LEELGRNNSFVSIAAPQTANAALQIQFYYSEREVAASSLANLEAREFMCHGLQVVTVSLFIINILLAVLRRPLQFSDSPLKYLDYKAQQEYFTVIVRSS